MRKRFKKANILTENVIFIILNLVFLSILLLFVFSKAGGAAVLEEKYAKQIALIIDSAKPEMKIVLDMEDALGKRDKNWDVKNIVTIDNNIVTVKLREKGGYSYSFFNNVEVIDYFDKEGGKYVFTIKKYCGENE